MYPPILKSIVRSPHFPAYLEQLEAIWKQEQKNRTAFYDWVTPDMKAEFIEGEIIIHSPVRSRHNMVLKRILRLIDWYVDANNLGYVGVKKVMTCFPRNDYEPDLCFFTKEKSKNFEPELTLFPVPDFVIEITSPATEVRDRGVKFKDYEANGVQEYWIIDPATEELEQYLLVDEKYVLQALGDTYIESHAIPSFRMPIRAIFDTKANLQALQAMTTKQ